ncbi:Flp family type IVb pilin [Lignipirellula cremea]|nr:Flp family type IVb pilin [Lignipirellula cremea]
MRYLLHFLQSEDGPTSVEYAIMLAMIVIGCLTALQLLSVATSDSLQNSADEISSHMTTSN